MKLNIGCGENHYPGYINIDANAGVKPDLVLDMRKNDLPYEDNSIDEIVCFHTLEHIEKAYHHSIFYQFNRVLKKDGVLLLSFPDFRKCIMYWEQNYRGSREFWEATIFGRQQYPQDYHVCAIFDDYIAEMLPRYGFVITKMLNEPNKAEAEMEDVNLLVGARKILDVSTYEGIVNKEVCHG